MHLTKKSRKIYAFLIAAITVITFAFPLNSFASNDSVVTDYDQYIFDDSYVHSINVTIPEEDWEDLKANPTKKTKYSVNVEIDGEYFENVSFATKGNTSLSSVATSDSDRYSFKLNFGYFVDGQTFHGMKKINLSNLYGDATYMKDYLSYEIFKAAGVDAPLTSYVQLSINGEVFGLYLAIEEIGKQYLNRTQDGKGEIYKPSSGIDNINEGPEGFEMPDDFEMPEGFEMPDDFEMPEGFEFPDNTEMPEGFEFPVNSETSDNSELPEDSVMPEGSELSENSETPDDSKLPSFTFSGDTRGNASATESAEETQPDTPSTETQTGVPTTPSPDSNSENTSDKFSFANFPDNTEGDSPSFESDGESAGFSFMPGGSFSSGEDLKYIDDDFSSYSAIFDNAETNITEEDKTKVVNALKNLSLGNIEEAVDADEVIRYFAAHNFVLNGDSYTGSMLHNYYLYERGGLLSMLPWDYNLAFGSFSNMGPGNGDDATELLNQGIDSPLTSASEEERPMWSWIVNNEEYLELYHEVYDELISGYFESGEYEQNLNRIYELIRPYVESDPTAFFTVSEFDTAYENLLGFCRVRSESIRKQLDGDLATVTDEQDAADRVDGSDVNISATGGMSMGLFSMPDGFDFDGDFNFDFDDDFNFDFDGDFNSDFNTGLGSNSQSVSNDNSDLNGESSGDSFGESSGD